MTISLDRPSPEFQDRTWSPAQLDLIALGRRLYAEQSVFVHQTSGHDWVVLDARTPEEGRSLLGLIEKRNDMYVVTQIKGGFERHTRTTLRSAIELLANTI